MNDRNTPSNADPVEELLARLEAGDPFADEVERLLNEAGGPVPIDDTTVSSAVASLKARMAEATADDTPADVGPSRARWWGAGVALAAAALVATAVWWAPAGTGPVAGTPAPSVVAATPEAPLDTRGVEVRPDSLFNVRHDTVVLTEGVVSVDHVGGDDTVHRVRLAALDVLVEPVGTVYYAGSRGRVAAVWVAEGRVRLVHDNQGHLGEVGAAGWAILVSHPDSEGIEVHRIADRPFDAAELGLDGTGVAQLMADMRWMALPTQTRAHILGTGDR